MKFQGRGNVFLAKRLGAGLVDSYQKICPDTFSVALATDSFEHINKCGLVDVVDYRGIKSSSGTVNFSFTDQASKNFAIATLGTVTPAMGATAAVTGEQLIPNGADADSYSFLGNLDRHRVITALTLTDGSVSPGVPLTVDVDYELDAASGRITWLTDQTGPVVAAYTHKDPESVSMLSGAQDEFAVMMEYLNKADGNKGGSAELYKVRFDPAKLIDFMSDELGIMELEGSVLADPDKETDDTEFGQFGRRV